MSSGSTFALQAYWIQNQREEVFLFSPRSEVFDISFNQHLPLGNHNLVWGGGIRRGSDEVEAATTEALRATIAGGKRILPQCSFTDAWSSAQQYVDYVGLRNFLEGPGALESGILPAQCCLDRIAEGLLRPVDPLHQLDGLPADERQRVAAELESRSTGRRTCELELERGGVTRRFRATLSCLNDGLSDGGADEPPQRFDPTRIEASPPLSLEQLRGKQKPTQTAAPSAASAETRNELPPAIRIEITIAVSTTVEPTDKSMPPDAMTDPWPGTTSCPRNPWSGLRLSSREDRSKTCPPRRGSPRSCSSAVPASRTVLPGTTTSGSIRSTRRVLSW